MSVFWCLNVIRRREPGTGRGNNKTSAVLSCGTEWLSYHTKSLVLASVIATLSCGPSLAQNLGTTTVSVCNKTSRDAHLAYAVFESKKLVMRGWYKIPRRECFSLGSVEKGPLLIYAETGNGSWKGSEYRCVPYTRFERTVYDDEKCSRGSPARGFKEVYVTTENYTFNLLPGR